MRISDWSSDVCSSDLRTRPEKATARLWPAPLRRRCSTPCRPWNLLPSSCLLVASGGAGIAFLHQGIEGRIDADLPAHGSGVAAQVREPLVGGQAARFGRTTRRLARSEEHTSELQSLMRISYDGLCMKKKK